ncbi:MAG: twin-arginine translocase TatA/TatE family subunit [Kofleriaceae bacterium]|nr:twin-arginine translocase TatA/TatE family subunit [Kofleriaceae bacterium]MBP9170260.1 twin-arginine translocase TatA/TatE family subunit [Kofleriaceae bacterium]MBP9857985.1 twin-arginine translocase TatA/TatE family subunit [Kofleriaceae bacterium]
MGMTEIVVILVVALLFLGPDKLPDAAKSISRGIRDLRKQTRDFQETIETDTEIGGAIRDIQSALRGDDARRPPVRKPPPEVPAVTAAAAAVTGGSLVAPTADAPAGDPTADAPAEAPTADAPAEAPTADTASTPPEAASVEATDHRPPPEPDLAPPEPDDDLADLIRPATGTIGRQS